MRRYSATVPYGMAGRGGSSGAVEGRSGSSHCDTVPAVVDDEVGGPAMMSERLRALGLDVEAAQASKRDLSGCYTRSADLARADLTGAIGIVPARPGR